MSSSWFLRRSLGALAMVACGCGSQSGGPWGANPNGVPPQNQAGPWGPAPQQYSQQQYSQQQYPQQPYSQYPGQPSQQQYQQPQYPQPGSPNGQQYAPPGQWNPPSPAPTIPGFPQLPPPAAWWPKQWGAGPIQLPAFPFPILNPGNPTNPSNPPPPANPGSSNDPPQHCVDTINQYRAGLRLAPLARWSTAEPCASNQGQNGFQTKQPHGAFGQCSEMAQNVCPNWPGPSDSVTDPCLKSMFDEGPGSDYEAHGHYINMTNPKYVRVACGYYTAPNGSVWAVQDFQ